MFYQVTAERILTSFLFGLLLIPSILHVAPVSSPGGYSLKILESSTTDPYDLGEG